MTPDTEAPEEGGPQPTASRGSFTEEFPDDMEANAFLSGREEEEDMSESEIAEFHFDANFDEDDDDAPSIDNEDAPSIDDEDAPSIDEEAGEDNNSTEEPLEESTEEPLEQEEEEAAEGQEIPDKGKDPKDSRPKEYKKVKSRKSGGSSKSDKGSLPTGSSRSSKSEKGDKEGRRSLQTDSSSKHKHSTRRRSPRSPKTPEKEKSTKHRRPKRDEQPLPLTNHHEPQDSPSKEKRSSSDPYMGLSTGKSRRRSLKPEELEAIPKPPSGKLRRAVSAGNPLPKDEEGHARPRRSESGDKTSKKPRPRRRSKPNINVEEQAQESTEAKPRRSDSEKLPKMSRPKPLNGRRSGSTGLLEEPEQRSKRASRSSANSPASSTGKALRRTRTVDGAPHLSRSPSIRNHEVGGEPERAKRASRRSTSGDIRSHSGHHNVSESEEPRVRRGSRHDPYNSEDDHKASKRSSRSLSAESPVPSRGLTRRGSRRSVKLESASDHSKRGGTRGSNITPRTRLRRQNTHDGTTATARVSMSAVEARRRKSTIRRQQSVDEACFPPAAGPGLRRQISRRNTSDNIGLRQLQRGFALQDARVLQEEELEDQRRQREVQEKEEEMLKLNAEVEEARKRQEQEEQQQQQDQDNTLRGLFSLATVGNNATDQMAHAMEAAAHSAAARAQLARVKAQQALTGVFGNIGHLAEHEHASNNNQFMGNNNNKGDGPIGEQNSSSHGTNNDGTTWTANWAKFPSMT